MTKILLRASPLLLLGASALALGCGGYTSSYVPPPDGRPRLVWSDDKVVMMASNPVPGECSAAVDAAGVGGSVEKYRGARGVHVHVSGGYYVPVRTVGVVRVHGGPAPIPRPFVPGGSIHVGHSSGSSGGLGNFSGGGDAGKGLAVVLVLAIATLPFIALGLAVGRPEPEAEVAAQIDRFNAHTDLARIEGSPCDEMVVAGQVAQ